MRSNNATRHQRVAVAALLAGAVMSVAGCGASTGSAPDAQPAPTVAATGAATPTTPSAVDGPPTCCVTVTDAPAEPSRNPLRDLWLASATRGTGTTIAARFLRALQDKDYFGAAGNLAGTGRALLAASSVASVNRVMRNVATHAELSSAGPCRHGEWLNPNAVVVTCGHKRVVVHLDTSGLSPGVLISWVHPRHDVYRGPHTHAFTTIDLNRIR